MDIGIFIGCEMESVSNFEVIISTVTKRFSEKSARDLSALLRKENSAPIRISLE